jgi:WD40 repeat protein
MGCGTSNQQRVINPTLQPEKHEEIFDEDLDREMKRNSQKGKSHHVEKQKEEEKHGQFFTIEKPSEGDQMLAIKPWLGALKPPTNPPPLVKEPPKANIELEYVYGYRCFDSRQNLYYTENPDEVVYMTAALGVVLNKKFNTQKIYGGGPADRDIGHTDDITSLALHPDLKTIATGEVGKNPKICIWQTTNPDRSINEFRQDRDSRAVTCLGFSFDGRLLAAADLHNDHNVRVWDWAKGLKLALVKGGPDRIFDLSWSKISLDFCTAGVKHVEIWNFDVNKPLLTKKKGIFGNTGTVVNMTCCAWVQNSALTGGLNGKVYKWSGNSLTAAVQVHKDQFGIHSINVVNENVLTGAKDNTLKISDSNLQVKRTIQMDSFPRAIDMKGEMVLCGLRDGTIYEIDSAGNKRILMESHCDGEVWGLAMSPAEENIFLTVGDDNHVKVWDMVHRKCLNSKVLETVPGPQRRAGQGASTMATNSPNQQARAICIDKESQNMAIGHNDGHVSILDNPRGLNLIKTLKEPKEWIESMSYSPNSKFLAVGSHDNFIYVYNLPSYTVKCKLTGHSSFIIALDWSVDSNSLHSNCGAYELLFWDVGSGRQNKSGATGLRDEVWHTWTAKLGWPVQGIYEGVIDMTHVNTVDRNKALDLVAVGNDWGNVVLFRFPNCEGAKGKSFKGHSEHVTNVKWNSNDEYLFSAGGYDQTIMQWKVIK